MSHMTGTSAWQICQLSVGGVVIVSNRVGEPDLKNRRAKTLAKTCLGKGSYNEKREREEQPLRGSDRVWREDVEPPEITLSRKANVL